METYSHDSISQIKRLLHSISMMHINIHIQHSSMEFQQL